MAMRASGVIAAAERAQRVRADIDYFDLREARSFWTFKAIAWGVPVVVLAASAWIAFA